MKFLKVIPFIVMNEFKDGCMEHGVANGYVAISPDNKFYNKPFDEIEGITVHGGLSFSEPALCKEFTTASGKKIKPKFIRRNPLLENAVYLTLDRNIPNDFWILGFDTFHYPEDNKYDQDLDFCINETLKLADQFSELEEKYKFDNVLKEIKFKTKLNVPECAELMTIQEFKEVCDKEFLINHDGTGNFVSAKTGYTDKIVEPSDAVKWTKESMPAYEYVAWFNN